MSDWDRCQSNMQSEYCQNVCLAKSHNLADGSRPSWCDGAMTTFCSNPVNKDSPMCSCFDPDFAQAFPGLGIASCLKTTCAGGANAYMTDQMRAMATNCPSVCINMLQLQNGLNNFKDVNFSMISQCKTNEKPCAPAPEFKHKIVVLNIVALVVLMILFSITRIHKKGN